MNNRLFRRPEAGWKGKGMKGIIPRLEPEFADFMTPEQHVPKDGLPGVNWETCMTMNTTWGYSEHDHNWKTTEKLIRTLIDIASKGGNYLLNIGPTGDGSIPPESVERLEAMGRWMQVNGESIYGSQPYSIPRPTWGRITQNAKTNAIYLHIFKWPADGKLAVEGVADGIWQATLLSNGSELTLSKSGDVLTIEVPSAAPDEFASVIRLEFDTE